MLGCREAIAEVVRSYGGDPNDIRQRLDNLLKYGKNDLSEIPTE